MQSYYDHAISADISADYQAQDFAPQAEVEMNARQMRHRRNHAPSPMSKSKEKELDKMPLAMAYVPWQCWKCLYEPKEGLCRGTIFKELDMPFLGAGGCGR